MVVVHAGLLRTSLYFALRAVAPSSQRSKLLPAIWSLVARLPGKLRLCKSAFLLICRTKVLTIHTLTRSLFTCAQNFLYAGK